MNWKNHFKFFTLHEKMCTRTFRNVRSDLQTRPYILSRAINFFLFQKFKISLKLRHHLILYSNTKVSNFKFAHVRSCIRKYLASLRRDRGLNYIPRKFCLDIRANNNK